MALALHVYVLRPVRVGGEPVSWVRQTPAELFAFEPTRADMSVWVPGRSPLKVRVCVGVGRRHVVPPGGGGAVRRRLTRNSGDRAQTPEESPAGRYEDWLADRWYLWLHRLLPLHVATALALFAIRRLGLERRLGVSARAQTLAVSVAHAMLAHGLVGFAYSAALAAFAFHGARLLQPLARAGRARAYTALVWAGGLNLLALNNRLQEYKPSSVAVFEALNAACFGGRGPRGCCTGPCATPTSPPSTPSSPSGASLRPRQPGTAHPVEVVSGG